MQRGRFQPDSGVSTALHTVTVAKLRSTQSSLKAVQFSQPAFSEGERQGPLACLLHWSLICSPSNSLTALLHKQQNVC